MTNRHSAHRTPTAAPTTHTKSSDIPSSALPCVVGGLLRGQPELALVVKAAVGVARLERVEDRLALVQTVVTLRPRALVIPPFDAEQTSTAPLVLRVRREAPAVAILIISSNPKGAGQPMLRAAQAGAQVITSPTTGELHAALSWILQPQADQ